MKKKLSHYTMLSLLLFTSCATEEFTFFDNGAIRLNVACQQPTRGTSGVASQQTVFDANAKLNVYIVTSDGTTISDNQTFTASAPSAGKNTLTPPDPTRPPYYPNGDKTVTIKAYYPSSVTNTTTTFSVASDQTVVSTDESVDTYKKSDLMTATVSGQVKTAEPVNLQFQHRMAKIVINATASDNLKIQSINLANVQTQATYNSTNDTWNGSGATGNIIVAKDGTESTLSGIALFPAQQIEGKTFIQVVTNKGTANFIVTSKLFQEGYEYTANLEVGLQSLSMTAVITDWSASSGSATITKVNKYGMVIDPISEEFVYDGTEKKPTTVNVYNVKTNEKVLLEKDRDYTLAYYNNTDVGSALIVASGKQGTTYAGSAAVQSYTIGKASPIMEFTTTEPIIREFSWNDSFTNSIATGSKYDGVINWSSSNEAVASVDNGLVTIKKPGTTMIKVATDGSGNYTATSIQYSLTVNKRSFKDHISITDLGEYIDTYNGEAKVPVPVVWDGGVGGIRLLDNENVYSISYSNNINSGTASVTVTGIGDFYDNTSVSKSFTINKVTPVITMTTTNKTIGVGTTYECKATTDYGTVTYSLSEESDDKVASVNSSTGVVTGLKVGTVTVKASVAEGENWNAATEKSITITVQSMEERFTVSGYHAYTCPVDGNYTFEVVGGAGGNANGAAGGKGGIVKASCRLTKGTVVHVYVGACGVTGNNASGGTNGTGESNGGKSGVSGGGSGGAASEIRIGGTTAAYRKLVAGGGGGSAGRRRSGRDGGGNSSGNYSQIYGENATVFSVGGGGGGGYVGGRQGSYGGAYGGSNYIDSEWKKITNGVSSNGPSSGSDTRTYTGYVIVNYEID